VPVVVAEHGVDGNLERAARVGQHTGLHGIAARRQVADEPWLYMAWDGEVLVDLIFAPAGLEVDETLIDRRPVGGVFAAPMPLLLPEDILVTKLTAMTEHTMDYRSCLEIAPALREQIDFGELRRRTDGSPFADAFFALVEGLGIAGVASASV